MNECVPGDGERRLMLEILIMSEKDIQKGLTAIRAGKKPNDNYYEALAWFEDDDDSYLLSFPSICDFLGLDAPTYRRNISSIILVYCGTRLEKLEGRPNVVGLHEEFRRDESSGPHVYTGILEAKLT